ncbi:MAG: hypothetical protein JXA22_10680 [Candidatus Thermoplasmatota archaeon]|nr:hypothetical protein [Candidatus Thermoplasmatota archaeon]
MKAGRRWWPPSPASTAISLTAAGALVLMALMGNLPIPNGPDMDSDGISDNFQKVDAVKDIVKDGEGWRVETVGYASETDLPFVLFAGSLLTVVIPLGAAFWLWDRPRRVMKVSIWREEGRMHDIVRRLSAFLEINPSLPFAVRLTRTSLPVQDQPMLGEVAWTPFTEGRPFSEIYGQFKERWSLRSPTIGRALEGLRSAENEPTQTEVTLSARALVTRLSEESKAMMEEYSRSLAGPATALFGIGVLLPILLATMIPVTGITGKTALMVGFVLWVIIPLSIILLGNSLVLKRPSLGTDHMPAVRHRTAPGPVDIFLMTLGTVMISLFFFVAFSKVEIPITLPGSGKGSLSILLVLLGVSSSISGLFGWLSQGPKEAQERYSDVRKRAPGILRDMASAIQEGLSFESGLRRTLSRRVVEKDRSYRLLPGHSSREAGMPEPLVSYLESAEEFSRAGRGPGGKAVRAFSKHIQELMDLDGDLSSRVRSAVGQMEVTASIFAPLMIGASAGIFDLMGSVQGDIPDGMLFGGSGGGSMQPWHFLLMSGGYLLMLSIATTLTIYRLEKGVTGGGWHRVPRRLVQSSLAFSLGVVASSYLIG